MKKTRGEKLAFTLSINVEQFYNSFEFAKQIRLNVTKNITFLDEYRNKHELKISSAQSGQYCYWDRHSFCWDGIQCPLKKEYVPTLKVYQSNINENTYAIQDSVNYK